MEYQWPVDDYLPSAEERETLDEIAESAKKYVSRYCRENHVSADPVLVGSVAKGTNLRGADLDLFIRFDKSYTRKEMEKIGLSIGHAFLDNGQEKYAEHPYVTGFVKGVKLDIVPCYRIEPGQKKVSSVDRTPLHTEYVRRNLDSNMLRDVLLLKIFTKSIGVYGSEVTVSGFSGYICEVLVIANGSFGEVMKSFASSHGRYLIGEKRNTSKFQEPVVIIDPVDDDRNAAAAISLDNLSKMRIAAKLFLKTMDASFLSLEGKPGKISREDRGTVIRIFSLPKPDLIDDVIYPQAVRLKNSLWSVLQREGFEPVDSEVEISDAVRVLIECRHGTTPPFILHQGPPVDSDNSLEFLDKWKNGNVLRGPYIREGRLFVDLRGDARSLEEVIYSNISSLNIGKHLNQHREGIKIEKPDMDSDDPLLVKFLSRGLF